MINVIQKLHQLCKDIQREGGGVVHCAKDWCCWNNKETETCTTSPYIDRKCTCLTFKENSDDNSTDLIHRTTKPYRKR